MENSSSFAVSSASAAVASASASASAQSELPTKKKRNLPGMPDPDAEVIALSPKTLLATNRFVCEICNKGFQREQNLQLHRRGHNLPWKLKQRTGGKDPVRKRVYVCPEPSCIHHSPARALGDLTGIKKHFYRKHGEKKWKCERCSKKYAVQSDWKAHMKTCGTKEYKCDCGTLFSRRDSFITHRVFCDALAEESSRAQNLVQPSAGNPITAKPSSDVASPPSPPLTPSTAVVSPVLSIQSSDLPENATELLPSAPAVAPHPAVTDTAAGATTTGGSNGDFGNIYVGSTQLLPPPTMAQELPSLIPNMVSQAVSEQGGSLPSLSLFLSSTASPIFSRPEQNSHLYSPSPQPAMSATALLQKAAQIGAAASNTTLLHGVGLAMSSGNDTVASTSSHGFSAGLASQESTSMSGLMMDQSSLFGSKPMTLDLLGLSVGSSRATTSGISALFPSLGGGFRAAPCTSFSGSGGSQSSEGEPTRDHPFFS